MDMKSRILTLSGDKHALSGDKPNLSGDKVRLSGDNHFPEWICC